VLRRLSFFPFFRLATGCMTGTGVGVGVRVKGLDAY
jgi:hypothetical protein